MPSDTPKDTKEQPGDWMRRFAKLKPAKRVTQEPRARRDLQEIVCDDYEQRHRRKYRKGGYSR